MDSLSCPFCHSPAKVVAPSTWFGTPGGRAYMGYCPECRASGPWKRTEDDARNAWTLASKDAPVTSDLSVIALAGRARSGKDTAAGFLVAHHGYHRVALADGVRSAFADLSGPTWDLHKTLSDATVNVRKAMQLLGTEARLDTGNTRLWTDLLLAKVRYATTYHPAPKTRFVVPDVRFPYEADWLRGTVELWGGRFECWRVERPGPDIAESSHASEAEVANIRADHAIANSRSLADLARLIRFHADRLHPTEAPC